MEGTGARLVVGWIVPTERVLRELPPAGCMCPRCLATLRTPPEGWLLGVACPREGAALEDHVVFLSAELGEDGETLAEIPQLELLFGDGPRLAAGRNYCRSLGGATHSKPRVMALPDFPRPCTAKAS